MIVKQKLVSIIIVILIVCAVFSCKKNKGTVVTPPTTVYTKLDSINGYYAGTTSGDSIYTYTDISGHIKQVVRSFSWPDTLKVSSADTATLLVASKYYSAAFPYYDSLTIISLNSTTNITYTSTLLQTSVSGQISTFKDTAGGINHLTIQVSNTYTKSISSNVSLFKRP